MQGTVCKILGQQEIKPHKVRYYMEQRLAGGHGPQRAKSQLLRVYRHASFSLKKTLRG
jgi:hypothetical protein